MSSTCNTLKIATSISRCNVSCHISVDMAATYFFKKNLRLFFLKKNKKLYAHFGQGVTPRPVLVSETTLKSLRATPRLANLVVAESPTCLNHPCGLWGGLATPKG
jgi:hypothetical protein